MKQAVREKERALLLISEQRIPLDGVENIRELGGYENDEGRMMRKGRLIRSGELRCATMQDLKTLAEVYDVGTVIDLRPVSEANERPDAKILRANYLNIPLLEAAAAFESATALYSEMMFGELAKQSFRRFFETVAEADDEQAVLFHDTFGNDEAGIMSALILSLLGFPESFVIEEYMLSGKNPSREHPEPSNYGGMTGRTIHTHALEHVLSRVKVEYGSVREYLFNEVGLGKDVAEKLATKFIIHNA